MVSGARVPIIKLKDKEKSFETDISVENWANVRNAFLLKCYSECDPRVKPLVITIKLWARKAEITDAKLHRLSGTVMLKGFFFNCIERQALFSFLEQENDSISYMLVTTLKENVLNTSGFTHIAKRWG